MTSKLTSIEATIPVMAYGNVKAVVETDNEQEAFALLSDLSNKVGNAEFASKLSPKGEATPTTQNLETYSFGGLEVQFDPVSHTYYAPTPNYLSGSAYADSLVKEFPRQFMAERAAKGDATPEDLLGIWDMKGEVSTLFGSSVHKAMELYYKHAKLSKDIGGDDKIRPKLPLLYSMVNEATVVLNLFFGEDIAKSSEYTCVPELFVASKINDDTTHLGFIDLAIFNKDTKEVTLVDYKTNADIDKKENFHPGVLPEGTPPTTLSKYWYQLSFYADIMKRNGYKVKELVILHIQDNSTELMTHKPIKLEFDYES